MLNFLFICICFFASVIGAICGIGGGVIIKPALDVFGVMDVTTISFLSGCTVLSMTTYSVLKSTVSGGEKSDSKVRLPMAIGGAAGGLIGKWLFSFVKSLSTNPNRVGGVQALCLLIVTIGTLMYTIKKDRIKTHQITNFWVCILIGITLGIMSSFLGIGGGPINLVLLFFFFSMSTKAAAETSLYIIFTSQLASLLSNILTKSVPDFQGSILILMVFSGIGGGVVGRSLNKKLEEKTVEKLFIGLMGFMILINFYNIFQFM